MQLWHGDAKLLQESVEVQHTAAVILGGIALFNGAMPYGQCPISANLSRTGLRLTFPAGFGGSRVGGGALARWPPSAAQTAGADFPRAAFTKT
jgi:hypothetical protein